MMSRFVALALPLLLAVGCVADEAASGCARDTDCPAGTLCWATSGQCLEPAGKLSMGLEVLPPENNQGWVAQEFVDGEREIVLASAISLQGAVVASNAPNEPLPAYVRVWRKSRIEGRPAVQVEASTSDTIEARGQYGYAFWLAPDYSYSLFATPSAELESTLPPALEGGIELSEHTKKNIVLDGPDRSVEVHGMVFDAEGKALPYAVAVRAAHEGGWLRSTPARTCADDTPEQCVCGAQGDEPCPRGHFAFRIPFGVKTYTLYVEPTQAATRGPDAKAPQVPVMSCPGAVLGLAPSSPGGQTPTPAVMELANPLVLPAFPTAEEFQLPLVGDDGEPVVGATVVFSTDLAPANANATAFGRCSATYKRTAITDAEGVARLWLLPGSETDARTYSLTVISPATSPYGSYASAQYPVKRTVGGLLPRLELARRLEIAGHVTSADGAPLAGARIEAEGVVSAEVVTGLPPGTTSTEADAEGAFVLYVDPGAFNFHIIPREGAPTPRFSLLNKVISAPSAGVELEAPAPLLWRGHLSLPPAKVDGAVAAASGYTVKAYASVPKSDTHNTAALRASATTAEDGSFSLIVAAPE